MQKVLTTAAHSFAHTSFLESIHQPDSTTKHHTDSLCTFVTAHSQSQNTRVFSARLSNQNNIMPPQLFIAWTRWYLQIPQIPHLGNLRDRPDLADYHTETCCSSHSHCEEDEMLDLHGNHANSGCPTASAGMHMRHTLLKKTIERFALEAACTANVEPKTHILLRNQFSREILLFPKQVTIKERKRSYGRDGGGLSCA